MPGTHGRIKFHPTLLLAFIIVAVFGCPQARDVIEKVVQPPSLTVKAVQLTGISYQTIDLNLATEINNPNPVGLKLAGIDYALLLAERPLASGNLASGLELKPMGQSTADFPLSLAYSEVQKIYDASQNKDELPYKLSGRVQLDTPVGRIAVPFQTSGMMPVVRPPKLSGVTVNVSKLSLFGADLVIGIKVQNPNSFPLAIAAMDYALKLEGQDFSSGHVADQAVPRKASGTIKVPLHLDFASAGSWAYSLIAKGKADYALTYNAVYTIKGYPVKHNEQTQGSLNFKR
ncbi:MAG TPA: LEA type 2 family protein [bacterium]|nr:LEA type 2 family protein [bacterium]